MRALFYVLRQLGRLALLVYFIVGIGLLGVRYWLLPNADQWRDTLEVQLADALGTQVSLGEVKAQWLGANPRLTLGDVVLSNDAGEELLRLPYLNAVLSWRTFVEGPLQFASIEASGLDLTVRRDADGRVQLIGQSFELSSADTSTSDGELPPVLAWLSQQRRLLFTDMTLRWDDALSEGGTLLLERAKIQVDNNGHDRRFALQVAPPRGMASMLDVRAEMQSDVKGRLEHLTQVSGRVYVNVRDWQSQAWRPWVKLPAELLAGYGSAQASLTFATGKPDRFALDTSMKSLRWQLNEQDHIGVASGRLHVEGNWKRQGEGTGSVSYLWQGQGVTVALTDIFERALQFDQTRLRGDAAKAVDGALAVDLASAQISNNDVALQFAGGWQSSDASDSGLADIQGKASHVSVPELVHYLPLVVGEDARHWMAHALKRGVVRDLGFQLQGELDAFPFGDEPEKGSFRLEGQLEDTQIDYLPATQSDPGWPSVDAIKGRLIMDRASLEIQADSAQILPSAEQSALTLRDVHAGIADLEHDATLTVKGSTSGSASAYLALVRSSALGKLLDDVLEEASGHGEWSVPLELTVPLLHSVDTSVKGSVVFGEGASFRMMPEMPWLERVSGALEFTESAVSAKGLSGQFLGGRVSLSDGIGSGQKGLALSGRLQAKALAAYIGLKGMQRLEGSTAYTARLGLDRAGKFVVSADSSLEGMRLGFPMPLAKPATQRMPLRVEWLPEPGTTDITRLDMRLGADTHARAWRRAQQQTGPYFHALGVSHGQDMPSPGAGAEVDVRVSDFNAKAWDTVVKEFMQEINPDTKSETAADRALLPELQRFRVQADKGSLFGLGTTQLTLTAGRTAADRWRMDISSTETAGTLFWQEDNGRVASSIQARLDRLAIGEDEDSAGAEVAESEGAALPDEIDIPAIDVTVGRFTLYGRALGELAISGVNQERGRLWRLDKFNIDSPAASLQGKGKWQLAGERRGLQLQADIQVNDLGAYMTQIGFADTMEGGQGTIQADLFWRDLPWSLENSDIQGRFELALSKGRFSNVNSRVARLLELLSLQSVKRLATFNFNPGSLLKNGFPYDVLKGAIELDQGDLRTQDYRVVGPAGTIVIGGAVHLLQKTLNLQAVVVPNLDVSGAAIAAGIAVNPIVGVGAFLAQWLLQEPLSRAMTVEYRVSGDWDNVAVEEVNAERRKAGEEAYEP